MTARRAIRRYGPPALALAIVVAVFGVVLPRIASYRDVVEVVADLTKWELLALAGATVLNVLTFAPPWRAALPGLGLWLALVVTQASTAAASLFPGGEAVGIGVAFGMLRARGFRRGAIVAAAAVVTAMNTLTKVALPLAAVAGLLVTGRQGGLLGLLTVIAVGLVGALLGAAILGFRTDASTRAFGDWLERWRSRVPFLRGGAPGAIADRLSRFRAETIVLLRERGLQLVVWTLVGHLTVFLVLLVSLRAVGVPSEDVAFVEAFAAWALTRLLTAIPITPGGLGIIELGLSGALVGWGGDNDAVVAAVLLYRLLTWLPPLVLGGPAVLIWRRLHPVEPAP